MNLLDCVVVKVTGPSKEKYNKWWVPIIYESWGRESNSELMCETKKEAESIKPGHKFLA